MCTVYRVCVSSPWHLSFSFAFFLHGESTVCASVDVRQHPPVRTLTPKRLARINEPHADQQGDNKGEEINPTVLQGLKGLEGCMALSSIVVNHNSSGNVSESVLRNGFNLVPRSPFCHKTYQGIYARHRKGLHP